MIEDIRAGKIIQSRDFKELSNDYFSNVTVYRAFKNKGMDNESLSYVASNDPNYLAHLLLNNGDGISLLTRDIYQIFYKGLKVND